MALSHVLTSLPASLLPYPYPATTRETFKKRACYQLFPGFTLWWGCRVIYYSPPDWPQPSTQLLPHRPAGSPHSQLSPLHTTGSLYPSVWIFFPLLPSSLHPGGYSSDPEEAPLGSYNIHAMSSTALRKSYFDSSGGFCAPLDDHRNPTFSSLNPSLWSKS